MEFDFDLLCLNFLNPKNYNYFKSPFKHLRIIILKKL